MFAPDQAKAARELVRAVRPGGRIGLVAHTPEGFIGQLFTTIARHVPPPAGIASPILWGTETRLHELFGDAIADITTVKRTYTFRSSSPDAFVESWRRWYGPTLKAFETVGETGADALEADLLALIAANDPSDDGTMNVPSEYLEAVIVTR